MLNVTEINKKVTFADLGVSMFFRLKETTVGYLVIKDGILNMDTLQLEPFSGVSADTEVEVAGTSVINLEFQINK